MSIPLEGFPSVAGGRELRHLIEIATPSKAEPQADAARSGHL